MLDRLKEYLEMFEQEKREIEQADDEELVAEMVRAYEVEVRAKLKDKRNAAIADKEADIKAVERLIALENAKIEAEANASAETEVVADGFQIDGAEPYSISDSIEISEQNPNPDSGISI